MYTYVYIYIYTHIHTHMCVYTHMYIYIYIDMYNMHWPNIMTIMNGGLDTPFCRAHGFHPQQENIRKDLADWMELFSEEMLRGDTEG